MNTPRCVSKRRVIWNSNEFQRRAKTCEVIKGSSKTGTLNSVTRQKIQLPVCCWMVILYYDEAHSMKTRYYFERDICRMSGSGRVRVVQGSPLLKDEAGSQDPVNWAVTSPLLMHSLRTYLRHKTQDDLFNVLSCPTN